MIIIFNENDKLTFFNNTTGLIEKSLLYQNSNSETLVNQPCNNYKFKDDLEILIRLYYNYRYLKEKENIEFDVLNKEKSESVYLINNNWIEKYKSFYEYNDLKDYLKQLNKDDKLYTTSFDIITKDYINKIISNLPMDYINKLKDKLKDKNKFESTEKIDKYETDIIKGTQVGQNIQI